MMGETSESSAADFTVPTGAVSVAGAQPEIVADRTGEDVKLILGEFAGPLDLLLYLIRQEQVSIYDIPVARITVEYLRYLRLMQEMDIAVAGDFLVMAATLIAPVGTFSSAADDSVVSLIIFSSTELLP